MFSGAFINRFIKIIKTNHPIAGCFIKTYPSHQARSFSFYSNPIRRAVSSKWNIHFCLFFFHSIILIGFAFLLWLTEGSWIKSSEAGLPAYFRLCAALPACYTYTRALYPDLPLMVLQHYDSKRCWRVGNCSDLNYSYFLYALSFRSVFVCSYTILATEAIACASPLGYLNDTILVTIIIFINAFCAAWLFDCAQKHFRINVKIKRCCLLLFWFAKGRPLVRTISVLLLALLMLAYVALVM